MKTSPGPLAALLLTLWYCPQGLAEEGSIPELKLTLDAFASYQFGQPKKVLHEARMAAYRHTGDERVRQHNEQLLLTFVESKAAPDARREACLWLGNLGTGASVPVLQRLLAQQDFSDVAQIALDSLGDRVDSPPDRSTALGAFASEVRHRGEPLALLSAAWRGDDEARSRHAFQLVREGVAVEQATRWLADHHSELSPQRQIIAMQVLLDRESPQRVTVIEALAREGVSEVRQAAVRNLGFLQRQQDVALLRDLSLGSDPELAEAARQALLSLPHSFLQEYLLRDLQSSDPATQAKAIALAESARLEAAAQTLVAISKDATYRNRKAAARALGKAAPAELFSDMIGLYAHSIGSPLETPYKQALWDLARKQKDHAATQRLLRTHAGETDSQTVQQVLEVLGDRLDRLAFPEP